MKDEENGVKFVYLYQRKWVEAQMYPRFTLLGQSLGSMYLGNSRIYLETYFMNSNKIFTILS
jgi:hypothetical protein